jgi:hypothetical protein
MLVYNRLSRNTSYLSVIILHNLDFHTTLTPKFWEHILNMGGMHAPGALSGQKCELCSLLTY